MMSELDTGVCMAESAALSAQVSLNALHESDGCAPQAPGYVSHVSVFEIDFFWIKLFHQCLIHHLCFFSVSRWPVAVCRCLSLCISTVQIQKWTSIGDWYLLNSEGSTEWKAPEPIANLNSSTYLEGSSNALTEQRWDARGMSQSDAIYKPCIWLKRERAYGLKQAGN